MTTESTSFDSSSEEYASRVKREIAVFKDVENVHDLPEIFHYWSNKYLRPLVSQFGFVGAEQFFAKYLTEAAQKSTATVPRFVSIGAGNCDTEVRVCELMVGRGVTNFVLECLDLNPDMLARGRELSQQRGVSEYLAFSEGDFNAWKSGSKYAAVMANQSLHHVLNLEGLFDEIYQSLEDDGYLVTSDIIGRNGHLRWPEVLPVLQSFWREMPASYRYNQQLKRYEEEYENWDCSKQSFEGIRAQDVLPLLLERFHFRVFIGFGNLVEVFLSRSFGHNFDANAEWDRSFIDRIHAVDESAILSRKWPPTAMMAVLSRTQTETQCARGLTPENSLRRVADNSPSAEVHIEAEPTTAARAVTRCYDPSYTGDIDWLPRRALLRIESSSTLNSSAESSEATLRLRSGPADLYRYFPFASYVYVDDKLAAIASFDREWQSVEVNIVVPQRTFELTVISELSDTRFRSGSSTDARELAVIFDGISMGKSVQDPTMSSALKPSADYFSQLRSGVGPDLPKPVFVIGPYRAGTSILTWAIGQHPNIWPIDETGWLSILGLGAVASFRLADEPRRSFFAVYDMAQNEYLATLGVSIDHILKTASGRRLDRLNLQRLSGQPDQGFDRYDERFQIARSLFDTKRRWVDGTPENADNMLVLNKMFPLARFVCSIRHPFDVIASMAHFDRIGGQVMPPDEAANMWLQKATSCLLAARALGPEVVKVVRYEEIVSNPDSALQQIYDFICEPRFPKAAETYAARMNSSAVTPEEREAVHRSIAESPISDTLLSTYHSLVGLADVQWEKDERALKELEARENDIVTRLINQVR